MDSITDTPVLAAILARKSVRRFAAGADGLPLLPLAPPAPSLSAGDLAETIVRAGMAAPTAKDSRPWDFIVVRDRAVLGAFGSRLKSAPMTGTAAFAIVLCASPNRMKDMCHPSIWVQDCAAATENMLLAAESLGLGAVWTALYPYDDRMVVARDLLGIPAWTERMKSGAVGLDGVIPFALMPFGVPDGTWKPRDKWEPAKLHLERW